MSTALTLSSFKIRDVTLVNRIVIPPMCTYLGEAGTGEVNDEHLVHYASLAEAGVGLIIVEATSVHQRGYVSPLDLGLWCDSQIEGLKRITDYIHKYTQSKVCIQLNHAGPKGLMNGPSSTNPTQLGKDDKFGGELFAASAIPYGQNRTPKEMTNEDIKMIKDCFVESARRAVSAGFDAIELHGAHGYLLHSFYSPLTNKREGEYGGSFENRIRFIVEVAEEVRKAIPDTMPLLCRLSCTDWVDGGWTLEDSVKLSEVLKGKGVDVIDCSSGGASAEQNIQVGFHYQVSFAEAIKNQANVSTIAVGGIESFEEIENILEEHGADLVAVGRAHLRNVYWLRTQSKKLNIIPWHPARQSMGFMASKRRQAKEAEARKEAEAELKKSMQGSSQNDKPIETLA